MSPLPPSRALAAIAQCEDQRFESVGRGTDIRFEGPDVIGSALLVDDAVIHGSFFPRPGRAMQSEGPSEAGASHHVRDLFERLTKRA